MSQPRLRVAIIGGGIGGLMFGISLKRFQCKDISVDIYESQGKLAEAGAGIGLLGRAWDLVCDLGLSDDLLKIAGKEAGNVLYKKADQDISIDFKNQTRPYNMRTFHRGEFLQLLQSHFPSQHRIHFNKKLTTYTYAENGDVKLHFEDGTAAIVDLVVGCDGIHSAVRTTLYRRMAEEAERAGDAEAAAKALSHITPKYSGSSAYRGLIPTEKLLKACPGHPAATDGVKYFGRDTHITIYPISGGRTINVVVFVCKPEAEGQIYDGPWVVPNVQSDLPQVVRLWDKETKALVECMDDVVLWAVNVVADLPTYVGDRVAILGDAAHAMTPHQGPGASQAFEDGYLLAGLLANTSITPANVGLALQIYDKFRRPFSQEVQRQSRRTGQLYALRADGCEMITPEESAAGAYSKEKLDEIAHEIADSMSWMTSGTSVVAETKEAAEILEAELARLHK